MEKRDYKEKIWKTRDQRYLKELQKLYDLIENVLDQSLRKKILYQVTKFDNTLTEIAEETFNNKN